jgi:hypothetical protein
MAIIQTQARIYRLPAQELIATGQCALHMFDESRAGTQSVSGTVVVQWTGEGHAIGPEEGAYRLETDDGRWLHVVFTKRFLTNVGPEVLRFRGSGPLQPPFRQSPIPHAN